VIARQSLHLTRMVDDLLDVGAAITGKMSLHAQTLETLATVTEALRTLAPPGPPPAGAWSSKAQRHG